MTLVTIGVILGALALAFVALIFFYLVPARALAEVSRQS
jgi:hypothetical protein